MSEQRGLSLAGDGPTASVRDLQGLIHNIGEGRVTERADTILHADDESMVWQETPSALAILLPTILKWVVVLVVCLVVSASLDGLVSANSTQSTRDTVTFIRWAVVIGPTLIAAIWLALAFASVHATVFRVTSQRLEVISGLLGKRQITYELHELGDSVIERPFLYRIFGVGNLVVEHRTKSSVALRAIANPEAVRDLLRGSGQFEAARWDKIRLR